MTVITIPAEAPATHAQKRIDRCLEDAQAMLGLLERNRITWLDLQTLLDYRRQEIAHVVSAFKMLFEENSPLYLRLDNALISAQQQLDAINKMATGKFLLNGPKQVKA